MVGPLREGKREGCEGVGKHEQPENWQKGVRLIVI